MRYSTAACLLREGVDLSNLEVIKLHPKPTLENYRTAISLANKEAEQRLGNCGLLSQYEKDRDFESPQHTSECHADSAIAGYVDSGISHGATLMLDMDEGCFVFFYLGLD